MQIDWLPDEVVKAKGRLGLTHMPGSKADRDQDLDALKAKGVDKLVCLQKPKEFQQISKPETVEERRAAVENRDIDFVHQAIGDFSTPTLAQALELVDLVNSGLEAGEQVVTHCFAGLGRAGTIAACVLVSRGHDADVAVELVRRYRRGAIQTAEQAQFVVDFAEAFAKRTREA